jgi:hypothetical protein
MFTRILPLPPPSTRVVRPGRADNADGTVELTDAARAGCADLYRHLASQKRVAFALGVHVDRVSRWRRGRDASPLERLLRQVIALESAGIDTVAMITFLWDARESAQRRAA